MSLTKTVLGMLFSVLLLLLLLLFLLSLLLLLLMLLLLLLMMMMMMMMMMIIIYMPLKRLIKINNIIDSNNFCSLIFKYKTTILKTSLHNYGPQIFQQASYRSSQAREFFAHKKKSEKKFHFAYEQ